jgi:hypothetical protein
MPGAGHGVAGGCSRAACTLPLHACIVGIRHILAADGSRGRKFVDPRFPGGKRGRPSLLVAHTRLQYDLGLVLVGMVCATMANLQKMSCLTRNEWSPDEAHSRTHGIVEVSSILWHCTSARFSREFSNLRRERQWPVRYGGFRPEVGDAGCETGADHRPQAVDGE